MLTIPKSDRSLIEAAEEESDNTNATFAQAIEERLWEAEDGGTRNTYILPSTDYVLKVDTGVGREQNKRAYEVWNRFKDTEVGNHLAPVVLRGPGFKYIVQKRAFYIGSLKEEEVEIYREMLGEFGIETMRSKEEFGRIGEGRVVLVDLGEVSFS